MQKYTVTMKVIKRYEIIKDWLARKINGKEASILLGVSYRHARRLKKAFKEEGFEGLIPKKGGGRNAYPESLREEIARLYIAEELESHIMGLIKKFDEEVGGAEDSELLQQFTQVSKNVVDKTLVGSRISKSKVEKEDGVYRAFVLMEIPLGDARAKLLDQLSSNKHLYTRFRASQSFQELKEEIDKLREFKKEQGY